MTNHPYPKRVVEAVASTLAVQHGYTLPYSDLNSRHKNLLDSSAQPILQALWDASRIDTLEQLEQVPPFSILVDDSGLGYRAYEIRNPNIFPLHVIFWGDHDDR